MTNSHKKLNSVNKCTRWYQSLPSSLPFIADSWSDEHLFIVTRECGYKVVAFCLIGIQTVRGEIEMLAESI